jgi:hypothetical protein
VTSITGGSINGDGDVTINYTDAAPNSYSFDMFSVRPSGLATTAAVFDTSLFHVEFNSTATPMGLAGDYNGDHVVNALDYSVWRNNLGDPTEADIMNNGNGQNGVDEADFNLWKLHYGDTSGPGSGGLAQVPEPASVVLLLIGGLAFGQRLRGRLSRESN